MAKSKNMTAEKTVVDNKPKTVLRAYNSDIGAVDKRGIALYFFDDAPKNEDEAVEFFRNTAEQKEIAVQTFGRNDGLSRDIFRVLYRAAEDCRLLVVIPAIILPSEIEQVRDIAKEARESLADDGLVPGKMQVGISIETPSAAILADLLAPMVDFFVLNPENLKYSLGANNVEAIPESAKRCMKMACSAAKREDIPVFVEN